MQIALNAQRDVTLPVAIWSTIAIGKIRTGKITTNCDGALSRACSFVLYYLSF